MDSGKIYPVQDDKQQSASTSSIAKKVSRTSLSSRSSLHPDACLQPKQWRPSKEHSVHFQDSLPHTPPLDDPDAAPPAVLPIETSRFLQGYGTLTFKPGEPLDPPPKTEDATITAGVETQTHHFQKLLSLTESEIRQAVLDYATNNRCYGTACAKEMEIRAVQPAQSFTYSVESFYEVRNAMLKEIPFRGGSIDGSQNGIPPAPWDIECIPENMFEDEIREIQVPHTSEMRECQACQREGYVRCYRCKGHGVVVCGYCHATGMHMHYDREGIMRKASCSHCKGTHQISCTCCHADGRLVCTRCDGYGHVKNYVLLRVTFTTEMFSYTTTDAQMPPDLVARAELAAVYEQVLQKVVPIKSFPVQEINTAAQRLANDNERSAATYKRLLKQRQRIYALKLIEVQFSWKGTSGTFWIHGKDNRVHAPDYPQKARCCLL